MKKQIYTLFALMLALGLYAQDQPMLSPIIDIEQPTKKNSEAILNTDTRTITSTGCSDYFYEQGIDVAVTNSGIFNAPYAPAAGYYWTALDDFMLDSESNVGTAIINVAYYGSDCTQFAFEVRIREDNNGYPGNILTTSYIAPGEAIFTKEGLSPAAAAIPSRFNAHLPITPIVLSAGSYYLDVKFITGATNINDSETSLYWSTFNQNFHDPIGTSMYLTWFGGAPYLNIPDPDNPIHFDLRFALCAPGSTPVQACFAPPPVEAVCQDATVTLSSYNGTGYLWTGSIDGGSISAASMNASQFYFDCSNLGDNAVTLTVYDNSGNSDQCTANVLVQDISKPDAKCKTYWQSTSNYIQIGAGGTYTLQESDVYDATTSSDNCGITSVDFTPMTFDCSDVGQVFYPQVTLYDASGNYDDCTAYVYVEGGCIEALCQNTTIALQEGGQVSISGSDVDGGSSGFTNMNVNPSTFSCSNLGTNTVTLTVDNGSGSTDYCTATVTVQDGVGLQGSWESNDIGTTTGGGNDYNFNACDGTTPNDEFTVTGSGNNATGIMTDNVAFASQTLCGDGSITAKIENVDASGYGGLMIRESTAAGSKMVAVFSNMSSQLRYEARTMDNMPKSVQSFFKPSPIWLKMERQGMWIHVKYSSTGTNFQPVQSTMVSMQSCVEIGLASFTNMPMVQTEATFSNVSTTGNIQSATGGSSTTFAGTPPTEQHHHITISPYHDINISPNPTSNQFTLALDMPLEQDAPVEILNLYGQTIASKILRAGTLRQEWATTDWAAGTYMLRIQQAGQAPMVKQFVVIK